MHLEHANNSRGPISPDILRQPFWQRRTRRKLTLTNRSLKAHSRTVRWTFEKDRVEKEEAHRKRGARYFIPALLYSASGGCRPHVQSITEISQLLLPFRCTVRSPIVVTPYIYICIRDVYFAISRFVPAVESYTPVHSVSARSSGLSLFHIFPPRSVTRGDMNNTGDPVRERERETVKLEERVLTLSRNEQLLNYAVRRWRTRFFRLFSFFTFSPRSATRTTWIIQRCAKE